MDNPIPSLGSAIFVNGNQIRHILHEITDNHSYRI
jgi:hypothetical protein